MKDYYKILGVLRSSTKEEIKKSYRRLALQYHPDRNKDLSADSMIKEINEAYDVLGDEVRRANYNVRFDNKSTRPTSSSTNTRTRPRRNPTRPVQKKYYKKKEPSFNFKEWAHRAKFVSAFILLYLGLLSLDYIIASKFSDIKVSYVEKTLIRSGNRGSAEWNYYIESPTIKFSVVLETPSINHGDVLNVKITPLFGIVKECVVYTNKSIEQLNVVSIYAAIYLLVIPTVILAILSHTTQSSEQSLTYTFASCFFFLIIQFV